MIYFHNLTSGEVLGLFMVSNAIRLTNFWNENGEEWDVYFA